MNNNLKKIFKHYEEFGHKHSSCDVLTRLLNKLTTTSYVKTVGVPFIIDNVVFHRDGCGGSFDIYSINTGKTLYNVYVNIGRLDVTEM
jgi:hypothetical protein